jgi:hypothetical protein
MSDQPGAVPVPNPCWCCGRGCMFCEPDNLCEPSDGFYPRHWCSECKYSGCEYCCGCNECRELGRAGWFPRGLPLQERIPHIREKEGNAAEA